MVIIPFLNISLHLNDECDSLFIHSFTPVWSYHMAQSTNLLLQKDEPQALPRARVSISKFKTQNLTRRCGRHTVLGGCIGSTVLT